MKTHVIFLAFCIVLTSRPCRAVDPALEVRQVVIRAPEMEVIGLVTGFKKTDAEVAAQLWQSVKEGRASVVSDVTSAANDHRSLSVSSGRHVWLPSELDQDFDRLYMTPIGYEEHFIGTSLECLLVSASPFAFDGRVQAEWKTGYSPRRPLTVKWPTSWLNIWENDKATDKLVHGWLDWRDLFEEKITGSVWFGGGDPAIIAILPPADQLWPGGRKGRWLDVFLAQVTKPGWQKVQPSEPAAQSPAVTRMMLFGIGVDAKEALAIMAAREPKEDAALLQKLLARVRRGDARMHLCAGSANDPTGERELLSARLHNFPTEMPSIPSSWDYQPVGTHWYMDDDALSLRQDLAPPARTEWPLAADVPEAIMWQPRFRGMKIETVRSTTSGTHLLSLLHIPKVMHSVGIPAHESVLIFAQHEGASPPDATPPNRDYEAEMIVFELPAKEKSAWQPTDVNRQEPDNKRFQALIDRVKSGSAAIAAHVVLHIHAGSRATASITEDYMTATEFDPPEKIGSPRMRPTALEMLPVGSRWEVDVHDPQVGGSALSLTHTFHHSTAKPIEPSLQDTLAIAATKKVEYPGAVHPFESWSDADLKLTPGQPRCLGTRKPPGIQGDVLHVAFVRLQ